VPLGPGFGEPVSGERRALSILVLGASRLSMELAAELGATSSKTPSSAFALS
jgi:hypothetical protein